MDTEEELAGALAALQRRSPEELAAFIVSLVYGAPPGVRLLMGIEIRLFLVVYAFSTISGMRFA